MMKLNNFKFALLSAVCLWGTAASAAEIATNAALMQAMDKVTGRVTKITVPVDSKIAFGDFSLVLRSCKKRPAEETPENFAFIDVTDKSFGEDEYNIFRGWVLSSTPGINAVEHPIYDVWLLECVDTEVDTTKLLSAEELKQRDNLPSKVAFRDNDENEYTASKTSGKDEEEGKEQQNVIRIKNFIQEDRDIEKDIREVPAYISEPSVAYVSDIEEGEEPENLLLFTKMQEVEIEDTKNKIKTQSQSNEDETDDELTNAIDAEINKLKQR